MSDPAIIDGTAYVPVEPGDADSDRIAFVDEIDLARFCEEAVA